MRESSYSDLLTSFLPVSLFQKSLSFPLLRLILFLQHPYIPGFSLVCLVRLRACCLLGSQFLLWCWRKDGELRKQGRSPTTLAQLDVDFFCLSQVHRNNFRCIFHLHGEPDSWQYLLIRFKQKIHSQPHPWPVSDIILLYNPKITLPLSKLKLHYKILSKLTLYQAQLSSPNSWGLFLSKGLGITKSCHTRMLHSMGFCLF